MKTVYLVRHGQTNANVEKYFNHPDEPLTSEGEMQAMRVAERAHSLDFERLLASSMHRAVQTAEAIAKVTGHTVESINLFREMNPPQSVAGKPDTEEKLAKLEDYRAQWKQCGKDPDWRYEDMESQADFVDRAADGLKYLESLEESSVMVVSHGNFIRALVGQVVMNGLLEPAEFHNFRFNLQISNAGISVIRYTNEGWKLLTFNDHAHFAE